MDFLDGETNEWEVSMSFDNDLTDKLFIGNLIQTSLDIQLFFSFFAGSPLICYDI